MRHVNVDVKMKNVRGENIIVKYPAYIFGMMLANKIKKQDKRHNLILVCGGQGSGVGSGKSTLVKGIAALECHMNKTSLNLSDFHWSMDSLINAMDSVENAGRPIIADEWIQSGGSRGFNITNIGNKLKIGFVTKRLKTNTYYLLVDEIREFPEKLVQMADALLVLKEIGMERGYVDVYTNNINIHFIWNGIKNMGKNWRSKEIRVIRPCAICKFPDYSNLFVDEDKYDEMKIAETRQNEETTKDKRDIALSLTCKKLKEIGLNYTQIGQLTGYSSEQIGRIVRNTTTT